MFRSLFVFTGLVLFASFCSAQQQPSSTTSCYLDDGRQVYIRYNAVSAKGEKISNGKPWAPGGTPMTLFTEAPLAFGGSTIPVGAYTVYPFPARDKWTLAINKNVSAGAAYDEKQDVARAQVETDQLPSSSDMVEIAFAHYGSKCTLRIVAGKTATFSDFIAK
jgi:hypothetical protein